MNWVQRKVTNTMRSSQGSGSHWVAVVLETARDRENRKARGNSSGCVEFTPILVKIQYFSYLNKITKFS